jgi:hypothetical protein
MERSPYTHLTLWRQLFLCWVPYSSELLDVFTSKLKKTCLKFTVILLHLSYYVLISLQVLVWKIKIHSSRHKIVPLTQIPNSKIGSTKYKYFISFSLPNSTLIPRSFCFCFLTKCMQTGIFCSSSTLLFIKSNVHKIFYLINHCSNYKTRKGRLNYKKYIC